ncbi:MAG TPA: response regulator [Bryobacteraceae bacterium]|nr:response regulator [Bryobacteraceae bacterium]
MPNPAAILIVDDDREVRSVLARMLEVGGYRVFEAANGKEAVTEARKHPVDLLITDLIMPEQEGIETIKLLRREYPGLKIIAISGAFGGDFLMVAGYLGAAETLQKPLRMDVVLQTVERILKPE